MPQLLLLRNAGCALYFICGAALCSLEQLIALPCACMPAFTWDLQCIKFASNQHASYRIAGRHTDAILPLVRAMRLGQLSTCKPRRHTYIIRCVPCAVNARTCFLLCNT
jgi:hypothetical protein